MLETLQSSHRAGAAGRPVHHRRIQLHHAQRVRQTSVADASVLGVTLDDVHARHHRLQRIAASF